MSYWTKCRKVQVELDRVLKPIADYDLEMSQTHPRIQMYSQSKMISTVLFMRTKI